MDGNKIKEHLQMHLDYYRQNYKNEWVGLFLHGSQNYGLDTEESDVDTKIIILPTLEDIVFGRQPISTTLVLPNEEHCDVKDIREMFTCFKKQNITYLEILFTEWKIINPEYEKLFRPIFHNREAIAHYNLNAFCYTVSGMSFNKMKSLTHPTPATRETIETYGYNGKDLCHLARINSFLDMYLHGIPFVDCLRCDSFPAYKEILIDFKKHVPTLDRALSLAETLHRNTVSLKEEFTSRNETHIEEGVDSLLEGVLFSIFTHSIRGELNAVDSDFQ